MTLKITTLSENTADNLGLLAEWGLSILIETGDANILLDTGQTISVTHNAKALGIDLKKVDKIVLSHGHADHTGGLVNVLTAMGKKVEIVAHPELSEQNTPANRKITAKISRCLFRCGNWKNWGPGLN